MIRIIVPFIALCLSVVTSSPAHAGSIVQIEYFFSSGCVSCVKINTETLPALESRFSGRYMIMERELSEEENYLRLVQLQEKTGKMVNAPIFMGINGRELFSGVECIQTGLLAAVESELSQPEAHETLKEISPKDALANRMAGFQALGIFLAGLADGLNPCSMASLIFIMGLLLSAKVKGRLLVGVGILFCLSSFITYLLLGMGFLKAFKALSAFVHLRLWLNRTLIACLLVLAFFSIRDAWRLYRGSGTEAATLKLPEVLREKIRRLARSQIRMSPILPAAFGMGFLVTILESVCTGQLYVPTLAWVARTSEGQHRAMGLLGLYNIGFILPLLGVFGAALGGTSIFNLLGWQQRHLVREKTVLGLLYLALAASLTWIG